MESRYSMAQSQDEEEVVLGSVSPPPTDHKRKHEDLESDAPEPHRICADSIANSEYDEEDDFEPKRQRFEDIVTTDNGHQERTDDPEEIGVQPPVENVTHVKDDQQQRAEQVVNDEEVAFEHHQPDVTEHTPDDNNKLINSEEAVEGEPLKQSVQLQPPSTDISQLEVASSPENQDTTEAKSITRKIQVPNNKVGVLIGKAGDTIRYLQLNTGARIQITRDVDADPYAGTRAVELIGTSKNIIKAEKLIKDVIAEADAGGSPALVARGFNTVQAAGSGEQIQIQVPNEKVGVIIGKGGETIKNLQTRSGTRIQLIPQHLPEGDKSQERTVRVTGDKKQIEMAREMIKEVMDQI